MGISSAAEAKLEASIRPEITVMRARTSYPRRHRPALAALPGGESGAMSRALPAGAAGTGAAGTGAAGTGAAEAGRRVPRLGRRVLRLGRRVLRQPLTPGPGWPESRVRCTRPEPVTSLMTACEPRPRRHRPAPPGCSAPRRRSRRSGPSAQRPRWRRQGLSGQARMSAAQARPRAAPRRPRRARPGWCGPPLLRLLPPERTAGSDRWRAWTGRAPHARTARPGLRRRSG